MATLEVCVDTVAGVQACIAGGADRIELCSSLVVGGLTPSAGMMHHAAQSGLPVYAMIRPRAGNFTFNAAEVNLMLRDIATAMDCGVTGVVLGAIGHDGTLDLSILRELCNASSSMGKTLHRAFDTLDDPCHAIDQAADLGFDRILTSGSQTSVEHGIARLAEFQRLANGRIEIMAGAGLTPSLIAPIHDQTGIRSFHASCSTRIPTDDTTARMGFSIPAMTATSLRRIQQFREALNNLGACAVEILERE